MICKTLLAAGGDRRQLALLPDLRRGPWQVDTLGLGEGEPAELSYDGLVLPLPALRKGRVPVLEGPRLELLPLLSRIKPGGPVVGGAFSPAQRRLIQSLGYRVEDVMDRESLVVENAKLTAQAVPVLLALEDGVSLKGKKAAVLGGGRVARALWPVLKNQGAEVTAIARDPAQLALARQAGALPCPWQERRSALAQEELVVNTVPAPVLGREELSQLPPEALVLDLASAPGGVDFAAAQKLGVSARLEPGLPGRWFAAQAGRILGQTIREILEQLCREGGEQP